MATAFVLKGKFPICQAPPAVPARRPEQAVRHDYDGSLASWMTGDVPTQRKLAALMRLRCVIAAVSAMAGASIAGIMVPWVSATEHASEPSAAVTWSLEAPTVQFAVQCPSRTADRGSVPSIGCAQSRGRHSGASSLRPSKKAAPARG
jgi:hypothetical protein